MEATSEDRPLRISEKNALDDQETLGDASGTRGLQLSGVRVEPLAGSMDAMKIAAGGPETATPSGESPFDATPLGEIPVGGSPFGGTPLGEACAPGGPVDREPSVCSVRGIAASRLSSFVKKVRMGKRIEKAFGRDKGQSSSTSQGSHEEDPNKTPEPHLCTGHFQTDFTELCRRNQLTVIPPVVLRARRPPSPTPPPLQEEKTKGRKDDKKNQPPPEPEPEPAVDENGEMQEPPPKTYITKDKNEYFKPTVQVEMDNPDKLDTVTELYIRGWKIDDIMMNVFKQCWPKMDRLHTVNLWHAGLTDDTLMALAAFIPECTNLKNLLLDNNPMKNESYHTLLTSQCPVQTLSLRYCDISDYGADLLGRALGTTLRQNQRLLSLNLNGNHITDKGAEFLANGLRTNRTLLSLGVAHNQIGDAGAHKLAEVVSRFPLTHEEIVERRKLLSAVTDRKAASPSPASKRSDSRDRPGSVRSTHAGSTIKGKSAKAKKDGKTGKEEEKHDKTKGKKEDKPQKKDARGSKGGGSSSGRGSGASVVTDTKSTSKKGHDKGKPKKGAQQPEYETTDSPEVVNPLLDETQPLKNGVILLKGNLNLINLNLSHNQVGEQGVKALLMAINYQTTITELKGSKPGHTGLMRLCVQRNKVSWDCDSCQRLNEIMVTKDPFYKPAPKSPDQEFQH